MSIWKKDLKNNVTKQAIKDLCKAYKKFFNKKVKHPRFKSKKKSKKSFYNDVYRIKFDDYKVRIASIGWMDMAENRIPKDCKYINPKISFDGVKFWLSISCILEDEENNLPKTEPIGINMGIKTLMTCSNGMNFNGVSTKREKKKLKRLQKKASRHYDKMMKNKHLSEKNSGLFIL